MGNNVIKNIDFKLPDDFASELSIPGKKIAIKYYLNIYLKATEYISQLKDEKNNSSDPKFQLYVRIIFNRQSVKIKSKLNVSLTLNEFDELIEICAEPEGFKAEKKELYLKMIREAATLTNVVKNEYEKVIDNDRTGMLIHTFDFSYLFSTYRYENFELPKIINEILIEQIISFSKSFKNTDFIEYLLNESLELNAFQLISFLKTQDNKWLEFEKRLDENIWMFEFKYYEFKFNNPKYLLMGATLADFKYLDFIEDFQKYFKTIEFKGLIESIRTLIDDNQKR